MLSVIVKMDMDWLENATDLEQACYANLETLSQRETQDVSLFWAKADIKQFYKEHQSIVVDRDREIDTYKWFLTELANAYALVGSLKYTDILSVYRQAIYFGTLS